MNLDTTLLDDVSNGDKDFKIMLIDMIKSEVLQSVPQMEAAWKDSNIGLLHSLSHKLKTTLGYAADCEMQRLNTYVEQTSKTEPANPELKDCLHKMNNLLPEYIQNIENLASSL